jgi:hypothetical protein
MNATCYKCQKELLVGANNFISRQDSCPHCYASLHACMMCLHYDERSYNECKEPVADRITDKTKANFCDYYKINTEGNKNKKDPNALLAAADLLFKKK